MKKHILYILLIILFSLPSIFPLFKPGFFQTDDGGWMIIRFSAFYRAFADGQFPVRWLGRLNYEYGYPVATFLYPGFMYLVVPIKFIGFGFVDTIKIILDISMIGSAVFSYLWLRRFFRAFAAAIGALVYLYAPYHLYDIYVRGSVGEILAFAIVPFILWQIERRSIFWGSISIGLLILAHNSLALLFLPLILLYMLLDICVAVKNRRELVHQYTIMVFLGIGLAAFFWIPAMYDLQYTVFSQTKISEWQNYFVPFELVDFAVLAVFLFTGFLFVRKKILMSHHRLSVFFLLMGMASAFLALPESWFLWNILPVSLIQFPFRFLSITILSAAFLTAFSFSIISKRNRIIFSAAILIITFFSIKQYAFPLVHFDKGEGFYATNMDTTTVKNEYMPIWVKDRPIQRAGQKVEIFKGEGEIQNIVINNKQISFTVDAKTPAVVRVNVVYWPGWKATIDREQSVIDYGNREGVMSLAVPEGLHTISVFFSETPVRLVSDVISFASIVILLVLTLYKVSGQGFKKRT